MNKILAVLRGLVLNPPMVAFARGALEAGVMAILVYGSDATYLKDALPEEWKPFAPLAVLVLRQAEGFADKIDPAKKRRRDELRDAAEVAAEDDSVTKINHGDVVQ